MRKVTIGVVAVLIIGIGVVAYYKVSSSKKRAAGPKTVEVKRGSLVEKALATGEIVPAEEIAVKSRISGTVARMFVQEGDRVRVGDPLLEVNPTPTPLEYAQKKRALEISLLREQQKAAEFGRVEKLYKEGMASAAEYDATRDAYSQASVSRKMAEEELAIVDLGKAVVAGRNLESVIASPVSGQVLRRQVHVGDPVVPLTSYQPGTELMTIADMGQLLMRGTVDEIDVGKIREGMPAEIKVGAFPNHRVKGRLSRISLKSQKKDNATVFEVDVADLVAPEGVVLRAGYSANADIIVKRATDVLVLPERVVEFRADSAFVQVPGQKGEAPEQRLIKTGMSDGLNCEVLGGLEAGDTVIEKESKEIK